MRSVWLVLFMLCLFPTVAKAEEPLNFHGFMVGTYDTTSNQMSPHARLDLRGHLSASLDFRVAITPVGPLDPFTYGELTWKKPTKGIDSITFGRQFPVFGRIWYDQLPGQVATILYSDIYAPLPAADTGVTLDGHVKKLHWTAGGFAGANPSFGNEFGPAGYLRLEYGLTGQLTLAASQRISQTPATGADIVYKTGRTRLVGELISSAGLTQEFLLAEYQLNQRLGLALQHEWLATGNRWTLATTYGLGCYTEVKLGYQVGENQKGRFLAQAVLRW